MAVRTNSAKLRRSVNPKLLVPWPPALALKDAMVPTLRLGAREMPALGYGVGTAPRLACCSLPGGFVVFWLLLLFFFGGRGGWEEGGRVRMETYWASELLAFKPELNRFLGCIR